MRFRPNLFPILLAALVCCWSFGSAPAYAASRISVLTFAPLSGDLPQGAGNKAADLLAVELKNQNEFEVAPREKTIVNEAAEALQEARKQLAQARAALAAHQPARSQQSYEAALAAYARGVGELDNFDELIEATGEYGALLYRRGQDDAAAREMLEATRLSAGRPLKIAASSPTAAPLLEALTKKVAALPRGSLRIDSTPEGAQLYVDGQDAGIAPVIVRDLPQGRHYVRAILPSGENWGSPAEIASREQTHLRAQSGAEGPAGEVNGQLAENRIDPTIVASIRKAATSQKATLVVFGALHRTADGLALDPFLFNSQRGKISRLKRVQFDNEMLDAGLQMDKVVSDIQSHLASETGDLTLPAKVALDRVPDKGQATEYRFGGPAPEVSPDQPAPTPPSENGGHRVVVRHHED